MDLSLEGLRAHGEFSQKEAPRIVGRHDLEIKVHEVIVEELRLREAAEVAARYGDGVDGGGSHGVLENYLVFVEGRFFA